MREGGIDISKQRPKIITEEKIITEDMIGQPTVMVMDVWIRISIPRIWDQSYLLLG